MNRKKNRWYSLIVAVPALALISCGPQVPDENRAMVDRLAEIERQAKESASYP